MRVLTSLIIAALVLQRPLAAQGVLTADAETAAFKQMAEGILRRSGISSCRRSRAASTVP